MKQTPLLRTKDTGSHRLEGIDVFVFYASA